MRTLSITAKCGDLCVFRLTDSSSSKGSYSTEGDIPTALGVGGGDYIRLSIDIDTGKVVGWEKPSEEVLAEIFNIPEEPL